MDVLEAIRTRRSIRKFDRDAAPVDAGELRSILDAGFAAPSAHNLQPRHYYVVRNREKRETIARIGRYTKMAAEADVCIVITGDTEKQSRMELLIMDCSASIQNMLLAAHGLGLGAVWCGVFAGTSLASGLETMLGLPPHQVPLGIVVVGRPGETRGPVDRFDPAFIHMEED